MLDHPNEQDHFIYKVELYDESDLIDKKIYKD
jgi:desulfoferrodoxin (superoxide reductase-like protein)